MSVTGPTGGREASQVEELHAPEQTEAPPPPPPPPEQPQAQQATQMRAMSGGFQVSALQQRFQQDTGIPPQSTDPSIAIQQNHNIVNPGNVTGTLNAEHPVQVNTPAEVQRQVEMMAQHWSSQPPPQNSLGVFPTAYAEMTRGLTERAEQYLASGDTDKAQAIYDVMTQFANRFFSAFDSYQRGDMANVPEPWKLAFDKGLETPPPSVANSLQMAMNAHILNDLPQTLRDLSAAGRPGFDLNSATDRAAFREYNDTFSGARLPITAALERNFPGNDVTTVAGIGEALGIGQFGVGEAVDLMRTKAWDDAANPNVTRNDLSRNTTAISLAGYHALKAAHGALDTARDVGRTIERTVERGVEAVEEGGRRVAEAAGDAVDEIERRASSAWNDFVDLF